MNREHYPGRIRRLIAEHHWGRLALIAAWGFEPFGSDYDAWCRAVDAELAKTAEPKKLVFGQKPGKR